MPEATTLPKPIAAPAVAPAAVAPAAAVAPVAIPGPAMAPDRLSIPGLLTIGKQRFGPGMGGEVRPLAPGISIEEAAAMTADNGLDEIFFKTEDGKAYVLFAERASFPEVKVGHLGRFEGKKIKVVAVNDEANTFAEGVGSVWSWLANVGRSAVGNEASRTVTTMVTTAAGSFLAAAAMKGSPAVAAAAPAAGAAAGAVAATAATSVAPAAPSVVGFVGSAGTRVVSAFSQVLNALGGIVLGGAVVVGVVSLIAGAKANRKVADTTTIDMVTGRY